MLGQIQTDHARKRSVIRLKGKKMAFRLKIRPNVGLLSHNQALKPPNNSTEKRMVQVEVV